MFAYLNSELILYLETTTKSCCIRYFKTIHISRVAWWCKGLIKK